MKTKTIETTKHARKLLVTALAPLLAAGAVACGGGSGGGGPDFGALHAKYTAPTGTLQASDLAGLASAVTGRLENTIMLGGSGTTSCVEKGQGSTCSCPGGGSITLTADPDQGDAMVSSLQYSSCSYDQGTDSFVVTGSAEQAVYDKDNPPMTLLEGSLDGTLTPVGSTMKMDLDFAQVDGNVEWSIDVPSGNVVVQYSDAWYVQTNTGSFTVIDKTGTYLCTYTGSSASCTGSNGRTIG
jgi:hypothetical protein